MDKTEEPGGLGRSGPLPLRYQLAERLRARIAAHVLEPGQQIPTEKALMEEHGVSRTTVREAIRDLLNEGLLRIDRGLGTFVAPPRIEQELTSLTGFVEDMLSLGRVPKARVVSVGRIPAPAPVAAKLCLSSNEAVVRIERVRLADGEPISFDLTYLPEDVGEKVIKEDLTIYPIFSLLEDQFGVALERAQYSLEARSAEPKVARALKVRPCTPLLAIERLVFAMNGRPVDYEQLHYRGDRIRYLVQLDRKRPNFRLWELQNKLELSAATGAAAPAPSRSAERPAAPRPKRGARARPNGSS